MKTIDDTEVCVSVDEWDGDRPGAWLYVQTGTSNFSFHLSRAAAEQMVQAIQASLAGQRSEVAA
jgi:hypothetical protein